ncbi:septum site-determining protein MinC [Immundisolibacter sp.]|uniref:septum site-determining protein MinC n=1 Tax=Immundisolibacter sp. TaxID=1934948 RepID=UPI00262BC185|nr:septum site-determining protein MinC [Immundisolibacter sp.]MDD3651976.1 septum site-determining protein MinC [Immundisolibacter sp.]
MRRTRISSQTVRPPLAAASGAGATEVPRYNQPIPQLDGTGPIGPGRSLIDPPPRMSETPAFRLKGSLVTLTVLKPLGTDLAAIDSGLAARVAQAPALFDRAPLLIDLTDLAHAAALDLPGLRALTARLGFVPVAVRGGGEAVASQAAALGLGVIGEGRVPVDPEAASPAVPDEPPPSAAQAGQAATTPPAAPTTRLVTQPVRSGQQVYSRGDLIVLAPVSPGAELLAEGHIHVYGPLRGRALAGLRGDTGARIYCRALEAELIAVAGCFQVADDIDPALRGQPAQVYLDGEDLVTAAL